MHLLIHSSGGRGSDPALAFGCRVAALLQAEVTVLGTSVRAGWQQEVSERAAELCGQPGDGVPEVRCVTRAEAPALAIAAQTAAAAYDLVVTGLLARGWLDRWVTRPPVRNVLRDVSVPVLIVPADRPKLRRILFCAGDLWYPVETIQLLGPLAAAAGAEVTLLYVTPEPPMAYPILREVEDAWGALLQTDTPQGNILRSCREALRLRGITTGVRLRHGRVGTQIMAEVRAGEYDLVALGSTYAAKGLRRYFVRSVTGLVVERARRPVLVVRHGGAPVPPAPRRS